MDWSLLIGKSKSEKETRAKIFGVVALVLFANFIYPGGGIVGAKLSEYTGMNLGFLAVPAQSAATGGDDGGGSTTPAVTSSACDETPNPTGAFRIKDELAASTSYLESKTIRLKDGAAMTSTTSNSTFGVTVTLACGDSYTLYVMPIQKTQNGRMYTMTAQPANAKNQKTLETSVFTGLEAKLYDEENKAYFASSTDQGWVELAASWNNDSSLSGSWAIAADGYIDSTVELRANNTRECFEGAKKECYMFLDADSDKWNEPVTVSQDGVNLVGDNDLASYLDSNDASSLNDYEYAYKLNGGICGGAGTQIRFYMETADGINPSNSDQPVLRFACKDYAVDDDNPDEIRYGVFKNNAAKTEILGSTYTMTLAIT